MLFSRLSNFFRPPLLAVLAATLLALPTPVSAKGSLPKPYVSRSLDVVLLPVTDAVRKEFKLGKKAAGAVVASVEPGGTGEYFGIEPGDVIAQVEGKQIRRPVDVDSILRYGLKQDEGIFRIDGVRKNHRIRSWVELSQEEYEKPVALDKVKAWRPYGGRSARRDSGYFYYADYCDYYYDDFYYSWDYSYTYIEEIIITEVYITSIESSETVFYYDEASIGYDWPDDDYLTEVDTYVYSEEYYSEYSSTEVVYEDDYASEDAYVDGSDDTYATDDGSYDEGVTDGAVYEEPAYDEAVYEEPTYEEPAYDETVYEEPAYEEPAYDETVYEEPAYDETVYEEQAYEEPVYEEPAYEEQAYEEPVYEEPVYEEQAYEEPVYEEPVYEEQAYEEPVYEEPVYAEPAYEEPVYEEQAYDGGGGCYYDDYGNEVC
jgi:PDZ domain